MNELDILKQQLSSANDQLYNLLRQCQGLQQEVDFYKLKYEGLGSIYNRQHLQSQLDQANENVTRYEEALRKICNRKMSVYLSREHMNRDFIKIASEALEKSS